MSNEKSLNEILNEIQVDLATVKTDVSWLKRLFASGVILVCAFFGIDMTGIVV